MIPYYKNLDPKDLFYINDDGLVCCEEWRFIPRTRNKYMTSNLARAKSLDRIVISKRGVKRFFPGKMLKQTKGERGYLQIGVVHEEGRKSRQMHILVAECFLGFVPNGFQDIVVDHIKNHERTNNTIFNIQIITQRENANKDRKGSSIYRGVSWNKLFNKWVSKIHLKGRNVSLGCFDNEKEASEKYESALNEFLKFGTVPKTKEYSSKYKGVSWSKVKRKWVCAIELENKLYYLNAFESEIEAKECYETAKKNWDDKMLLPESKVFSSKYKGVCYDKQCGKWRARKTIKGVYTDFGKFDTELEAYNSML